MDDDKEELAWQARHKALERGIAEIEARQARLMRTLETEDDPSGMMFSRVRERMAELEQDRRVKLQEIEDLASSPPSIRSPATDLLERLPVVEAELSLAPENVLRPLFDAFRLEVRYSRPSNHCTIRVTISDDSLDSLVAAIEQIGKEGPEDGVRPPSVSHVVRAPGRIRTCGLSLRRRTLYPLSYGGKAAIVDPVADGSGVTRARTVGPEVCDPGGRPLAGDRMMRSRSSDRRDDEEDPGR